jgi:hydroxyacylglutathione hydrolase
MSRAVKLSVTLKKLGPDEALVVIDEGGAYVDLRKVAEYLDVHIPGSLSLQYEFGPGLPGRARDCVPLNVPLVLLEDESTDTGEVAAALRGKGFTVEGVLAGGIREWSSAHGTPASTDVIEGAQAPAGGTLVNLGDPGARAPEDAMRIPIERLWAEADRVPKDEPVILVAGHGLRAALAIGILERAGVSDITLWWTRRPSVVKSREGGRFRFLRAFND